MDVVNLLATLGLIGITAWYAYSTAQMLDQMRYQANVVREQSVLLAKTAQISALVSLSNAAAHPPGENAIQKLRLLLEEVELIDARQRQDTQQRRVAPAGSG